MRAAWVCLLLAACVGGNPAAVDALPADATDAAIDTPPPPFGCDWGELADIENPVTPEATHLVFGSQLVMCGEVDIGHENPTTTEIDGDVFGFSLAVAHQIRVTLTGTLGSVTRVELAIVNRFGDPITTSSFVGAHAVVIANLPAGEYGVSVRALGTPPAAAIAYQATITADASTCTRPAITNYTEQSDGTSNAGNDVIEVRYTGDPALRRAFTTAADSPETTAITLATTARITGSSANVDAADDFHDRDAYLVTTAAGVAAITVRLDWTSPTADLDVFVFAATAIPELAASTHVTTTAPEEVTLAVLPSTDYLVWVGSYDSSTGLPATYDVTLCVP